VQAWPSLQALPVFGVTVQVEVPLHARVLHWSSEHVIGVPPAQVPELLQVSPWVQAFASSQATPVFGVTAQVEVPSHARVLHWSSEHVIGVPPAQVPELLQVSP